MVDLTELRYWFSENFANGYLDSFLQRLNYDKYRLPKLRCLRFTRCKKILSSWNNIDQWIDFILSRIMEHQLTCVRFDFVEEQQKK